MNDEASFPEGEKPRYLLPDGCRDLIDVLRAGKSDSKLMYVYAGGKSLGPSIEIPESESVPMGLSALSRYIDRLFASKRKNVSLMISQDGWLSIIGVLRANGRVEFEYFSEGVMAPRRDEMIRAFATSRSLPITTDEQTASEETRRIAFLLPQSANAVTTLCREVLTTCFGVQPYERLLFNVFEFD
jgi:hypothetical protein